MKLQKKKLCKGGNMLVKVEQDAKKLIKASGNFLEDMGCYEVELIRNNGADTTYRIELADNDYLDITVNELRALKAILNNKSVESLLEI